MADEPFVSGYSRRKNRVVFMAGGKQAGAASSVPPCDGSCDNYVLTNVAGVPTWLPATTAFSGLRLDPLYWLHPFLTQEDFAVNNRHITGRITPTSGGLGFPYPVPDFTGDVEIASGTGTSLEVLWPDTTNGYELSTPLSGDAATYLVGPSIGYKVTWSTAVSGISFAGYESPYTMGDTPWLGLASVAGSLTTLNVTVPNCVNNVPGSRAAPLLIRVEWTTSATWSMTVPMHRFTSS